MTFEWSTDVDEAKWWVDRLGSAWDAVAGFVPNGFEAYARVAHSDGSEGSLSRSELATLAELLGTHTDTPSRLWAAVWEGFGNICDGSYVAWIDEQGQPRTEKRPPIAPKFIREGPRIVIPSRELVLLEGAIEELDDLVVMLGFDQSPTVWWPQDRSWIVVTEIDFSWTYVCGNEVTIQDVLAALRLGARRVSLAETPG